ncbi:hypothetical protein HHI36_001886 [Cryptolaemus montrouzieri]|uniref:Ubiquinone biosynthesis O-methyltransferase, mitochondrial n=1 Tax=Cryptolaemus montrouzieri TaxID=559131 RepID=A0ABD2P908_9CUCU
MLSRKLLSNLKFLRCFTTNTSIDKNEVEFFSRLSSEWWNETGTFKPLHSYNKLRVPFIREGLIQNGVVDLKYLNTSKVLKGLRILDVGCGGGILTESLSRLGADVTGLDADNEAIKAAENHLKVSNIEGLSYSASSVEHHAIENEEIYDAVVASEILEHVINKDSFIENCLKCLKPKGLIFFTTINKTIIADILGIQIAECIGLVPEGTHEIDKFIHPHELQRILEKYNCQTKLVHGMRYNFLSNTWSWTSDTSINYGLYAVKYN